MRRILHIFLFCFTVSTVPAVAKGIVPGSVIIGATQFVLDSSGQLTMHSPQVGRALEVVLDHGHIERIFEIHRRLFMVGSNGHIFLLQLPEKMGFVARHMGRAINSSLGGKILWGDWKEKYLLQTVALKDELYIMGQRHIITSATLLERSGAIDIVFQSIYGEIFHVRELLEQMDAEGAVAANICANFLNARHQ